MEKQGFNFNINKKTNAGTTLTQDILDDGGFKFNLQAFILIHKVGLKVTDIKAEKKSFKKNGKKIKYYDISYETWAKASEKLGL